MDGDFRTTFVRDPAALKHFPALVLNADYRPLSYYPLSLWPWQEAVKAAFLDRVQIVARIRPGGAKPAGGDPNTLGRGAEGLRETPEARGLHALQSFSAGRVLLPVLRGTGRSDLRSRAAAVARRASQAGRTSWRPVRPCNLRKGSKTLKQSGLRLKRQPRQPTVGRDAERRAAFSAEPSARQLA